MGIYDELRGFVLAHRKCGDMKAGVGPQTDSGYRVLVKCGCGTEFKPRGAEDIPFPLAVGSVRFVPVLGEAR
jgi:hypothetical protein